MLKKHRRINRERKTIEAMIKIYCQNRHKSKSKICLDCQTILNYATNRLKKCPFHDKKPTCIKCKIHCYNESERIKIKQVMRYSGPRMLFKHPILAIYHLIDKSKNNSK